MVSNAKKQKMNIEYEILYNKNFNPKYEIQVCYYNPVQNKFADYDDYFEAEPVDDYKKNVLEIGCGTGYLLNHIKKFGAYVQGLEPSKVKKIKKIKIEKNFYLKKKFDKKFDIIFSNAVLEHEFDPNKF